MKNQLSKVLTLIALTTLGTAAKAEITYHGGPILSHARFELVFLGTEWQTDFEHRLRRRQLETAVQVLARAYVKGLAEYGVGIASCDPFTSVIPLHTAKAIDPKTGFEPVLQGAVASRQVAWPEPQTAYLIFLPKGYTFTVANVGGFHRWMPVQDAAHRRIAKAFYAVMKFSDSLDVETAVTTHEMAEMVTDPQVGYSDVRENSRAWIDAGGPKGGEVGDLCEPRYGYMYGYRVSEFYSDRRGCITSP